MQTPEYDALVERGREAVANITKSKWVLGDLLLEVTGAPEHGGDRGNQHTGGKAAHASLAAFAEDVGLTHDQAKSYRLVAYRWPPERRRLDVSWTVHRALGNPMFEDEERFELIHSREGWTLRDVEAYTKPVDPEVLPSADEVITALEDPEVRSEVLGSMPDGQLSDVAREATSQFVANKTRGGAPPKHVSDEERAARDAQDVTTNPTKAWLALSAFRGSVRSALRELAEEYQNFVALVDDEDLKAQARDEMVAFQADMNGIFSRSLRGDYDSALADLLGDDEQEAES